MILIIICSIIINIKLYSLSEPHASSTIINGYQIRICNLKYLLSTASTHQLFLLYPTKKKHKSVDEKPGKCQPQNNCEIYLNF